VAEDLAGAEAPTWSAAFPVPLILLTDRHQAGRALSEVVAAAVAGGLRLVVVREKDLPLVQRSELAERLRDLLGPVGGRVLLAGSVPGPDGRHLAAADPWPDPWPDRRQGLLGRSCHHRHELAVAAGAGADYATLSPIFPTESKPGYGPALGPRILAGASPLPVYALGGIATPSQARDCVRAGATGVAVMGALMRAPDPAAVAAGLIAAVADGRRHGRLAAGGQGHPSSPARQAPARQAPGTVETQIAPVGHLGRSGRGERS
jgi:thiamine-phosphate pyrophosphorylase